MPLIESSCQAIVMPLLHCQHQLCLPAQQEADACQTAYNTTPSGVENVATFASDLQGTSSHY